MVKIQVVWNKDVGVTVDLVTGGSAAPNDFYKSVNSTI